MNYFWVVVSVNVVFDECIVVQVFRFVVGVEFSVGFFIFVVVPR